MNYPKILREYGSITVEAGGESETLFDYIENIAAGAEVDVDQEFADIAEDIEAEDELHLALEVFKYELAEMDWYGDVGVEEDDAIFKFNGNII